MSWGSVSATVLPVLTLILGYFGTTLTEARRERRIERREDRRRREAFELGVLLDLSAAIGCYVRACGLLATRKSRRAPDRRIYDAEHQLHEAERELIRLNELVLDDQIRTTIHAVRMRLTEETRTSGETDLAHELLQELGVAAREVGARVRDIYEGSR